MLCLLSDLTVHVKPNSLVVLFVNILTSKPLKINWQIYLSFSNNCILFLQYPLLLGVLYKAFDKANRFFVDVIDILSCKYSSSAIPQTSRTPVGFSIRARFGTKNPDIFACLTIDRYHTML